ncbi:Spermidine/putrescine-binding periplasmic protein (PotD) (PDB:1POT) [Commensalibacter communis]|uniref:Spermidine/putrescine-binding periplasmic protein (PotD) n=1 Tax=Commensalibacter communis TaxID=2972786 RepID=A0A9W4TPE9_9PROT|nr:Spermidine/putrescine-binding periplasmic protein (PotD) (PDB:1POT) [Commensalibacter communis]CAI3941392.1 Spermidine/putrescine-binding periplasmic protein (PotD) (PDB:1POT) [Commensalibacter communis]CAI3942091.1 Spermidine/putrescine-binding periplasmic protein (PotD) (PDB:1POT) [Commensalibacter communis]CAI3947689.1 Spermidine/putrescine-binding periplasmic protein (PotD) (PDB:1POT) [Commensalibacter communis]CAI3947936.1 Spermidine/putrescine-binding periplasmic protein (PotD) (PDB:1P
MQCLIIYMYSPKFIFLFFLFSIISIPPFCFAHPKENKINIGILNGYQLYLKKYSQKYRIITWDGHLSTLQKALSQNKSPVDILLLNEKIAEQACNLGLLIAFPEDLLSSNDKQCNFQTITDHITLAWDTDKVHFNPTWKDFWNITQYPGKRGLQKDAFSALSIALLADDVPFDEVTEVLSTPAGILRAFKKLNQLRPYIVWWTTPNEANFLLHKNQVLMTSGSILSISAFQKQYPLSHFQYQYKNTIENPIVFSIPATIPTQRIKLINSLLQHPSFLSFPSADPKQIMQETIVKEETNSFQQPTVSLDDIFDEWLVLTKQ